MLDVNKPIHASIAKARGKLDFRCSFNFTWLTDPLSSKLMETQAPATPEAQAHSIFQLTTFFKKVVLVSSVLFSVSPR